MCSGQKSQHQYCAAMLGGEETKIQITEEGVCTEFRKRGGGSFKARRCRGSVSLNYAQICFDLLGL